MNNLLNKWPGSVIDRVMIAESVGQFLRTHRSGRKQLLDLLESVPADRTEAEYVQELEASAAEHEAAVQQILDDHNAQRVAKGQPPVDRQGNPVSEPAAS